MSLPNLDAPSDGGVPVMAPGDSTPIVASVKPCGTNDTGEKGEPCSQDMIQDLEYTVIAVDKGVLELIPYELQDLAEDFSVDLSTYFSHSSSSDYLYAPGALSELLANFIREQEENPWKDISSRVS